MKFEKNKTKSKTDFKWNLTSTKSNVKIFILKDFNFNGALIEDSKWHEMLMHTYNHINLNLVWPKAKWYSYINPLKEKKRISLSRKSGFKSLSVV